MDAKVKDWLFGEGTSRQHSIRPGGMVFCWLLLVIFTVSIRNKKQDMWEMLFGKKNELIFIGR